MQNEFLKLLKLKETATHEQIEAKYKSLKAKYSEDRFLAGEKGNEAASKLTELETAYLEFKKNHEKLDSENIFKSIIAVIDSKDFSKAQEMLDERSYHCSEWHYVQAMLFYRREWVSEALNQLEFAIKLDPTKQKYYTAKDRIKNIVASKNTAPEQLGNNQNKDKVMQQTDKICGPCAKCCACAICMDCCLGCCDGCSGGGRR